MKNVPKIEILKTANKNIPEREETLEADLKPKKDRKAKILDVVNAVRNLIPSNVALEQKEVVKHMDTRVIGDLHGNFFAFMENLKTTGFFEFKEFNRPKWIAGNSNLYILGDFLADRNSSGLKIAMMIAQIEKEAKVNGGNIATIVGNHDQLALDFLTNRENIAWITGCSVGLFEFIDEFGDIELQKHLKDFRAEEAFEEADFKYFIDFLKIYNIFNLEERILKKMRSTVNGKIILRQLAKFKVIDVYNNAILLHTDPTEKILEYLIKEIALCGNDLNKAIEKINKIYQTQLNFDLFESNNEDYQEISKFEYYKIIDTFVSTENRSTKWNEVKNAGKQFETLKKQGIDYIIHGHSHYQNFPQIFGEIGIYSVDTDFGKNFKSDFNPAVGIITDSGNFIHPGEIETT